MGKRLCIALAAGVLLPLAALALYAAVTRIGPNPKHAVGEQLDELNGVAIYYNGGVNTVQGRNLTQDGYNLGLRRHGHVAIIASVGTDTLHARFHWVCSVSRQLIILGPRFESVWAHHLQSRALRGFFICAGHHVCPIAVALQCWLLPPLANNQIAYKQQERFLDSLS